MSEIDVEIAELVSKHYHDPLGFALVAFELTPGERIVFEKWQVNLLGMMRDHCVSQMFTGSEPADPFKFVAAAGHGVGKSMITAVIILWLMSTRPHTRGVVTASTQTQLKTKTWAELAKWADKCITGHWFDITATAITHRTYHKTWRTDALTAREENSESFAGLHNAQSTPYYIFDESSSIPDKIWEVAEGGLTDGEPFFLAFGNPTRNTGMFKKKFSSNNWHKMHIDSRECNGTNKKLISTWEEEYGEDSDFFRVRVRGVFPNSGDSQLIAGDVCTAAMTRATGRFLPNDPLVCGIDVARGGGDNSFIVFRRGYDGRSEKVFKIGPDKTKDSERLVSIIANKLNEYRPTHTFIDATGLGGPIFDRLRNMGYPMTGVIFNEKPDSDDYANKVTEIWFRMAAWLKEGGCIKASHELERQLTSREYFINKRDKLALESKADMKDRLGADSPDWADALAVTFAHPVYAMTEEEFDNHGSGTQSDYDPLDAM